MQASWKVDPDKNTFILLDRSLPGDLGGAMAGDVNLYWNDAENPRWAEIEVRTHGNILRVSALCRLKLWSHGGVVPRGPSLASRCNAHGTRPHPATTESSHVPARALRPAASQVMVAERRSRGKGMAAEALRLMMCTALARRNAAGFTAKISISNLPSRRLFEKIGFVLVKEVPCFDEVHYQLSQDLAAEAWEQLVADATAVVKSQTTAYPQGAL